MSKSDKPTSYYTGSSWPAERAVDIIDELIDYHKRQARYFKQNREGFATSEEEFRLLLEHGLGWDQEDIDSLVKEVREKREKREK